MNKNYYLYKFAELAQTTDAVSNAKNVSGGKGAGSLNLPLPKMEDTSKPKPIGVKKPIAAPSFKGILNPLPTTNSSLTKSAATHSIPSYEDAQKFWKNKNTRKIRDEFQGLVKTIGLRNKIGDSFQSFSDSLYSKNQRWHPKNWLRNSAAFLASIPINIAGGSFNLGNQAINTLWTVPKVKKLLEAHPELAYTNIDFKGPTAAIRHRLDGNKNADLFNVIGRPSEQLLESAISTPFNVAILGGMGAALKQPIKGFTKNVVYGVKNKPFNSAVNIGLTGSSPRSSAPNVIAPTSPVSNVVY